MRSGSPDVFCKDFPYTNAKAEPLNCETIEETHARSSILSCVRASNPVFTVERSGFVACFRKLAEFALRDMDRQRGKIGSHEHREHEGDCSDLTLYR